MYKATLFIAYLLPEQHLNICRKVQYIINFLAIDIENENNCFVLKNTQYQPINLKEKQQNHLNWILTATLQLNFVPGLMPTISRLFRSDEKLHFHSHHCTQLPKISQSIEQSRPGSQRTVLGQVKTKFCSRNLNIFTGILGVWFPDQKWTLA